MIKFPPNTAFHCPCGSLCNSQEAQTETGTDKLWKIIMKKEGWFLLYWLRKERLADYPRNSCLESFEKLEYIGAQDASVTGQLKRKSLWWITAASALKCFAGENVITVYKFGKVQHCRSSGKRYLRIKIEPVHYQLSRCGTNSLPLSLLFRGKVMPEVHIYINNIQNHGFYMLLGSYPFRLRGVWGNDLEDFYPLYCNWKQNFYV